MLKLVFSRPPETVPSGWLVDASMPVVAAREPMQRFFAVGAADNIAAERLLRQALGNLHCKIAARMRLPAPVLASCNVRKGEIQELDTD